MSRSPWEPTWRRLAATTAVLFAIIFAFLAGRVRAGADPGLRSTAAQTQSQTQTQPDTVSPPAEQTPSQPYEQQQQPDFGVPEDSDPPSTHVS
jgi:hypothetical protein